MHDPYADALFFARLMVAILAAFAFVVVCYASSPRVRLGAVAVMLAALLFVASALAAPPPGANGQFKDWFEGLKDSNGRGCCDLSDCRMVRVRYTRKGYEALITPETHDIAAPTWIEIPDEKVITPETGNPTGSAVVCWLPNNGVQCFVRPPEI